MQPVEIQDIPHHKAGHQRAVEAGWMSESMRSCIPRRVWLSSEIQGAIFYSILDPAHAERTGQPVRMRIPWETVSAWFEGRIVREQIVAECRRLNHMTQTLDREGKTKRGAVSVVCTPTHLVATVFFGPTAAPGYGG